MCLNISESPDRKRAKSDIRVYKVLFKNKEGELLTPYQKQLVKVGCTYTSELSKNIFGEIKIGLHSFTTIEGCEEDIKFFNGFRDYIGRMCICSCTIPDGTWYYEGIFDGQPCIASQCLIYDKII